MQLRIHKPDRNIATKRAPAVRTPAPAEPVSSWLEPNPGDLSLQRKVGCSCGGTCPACRERLTLQPRLRVGAVNDPAEREADAMADRVMRMAEPGLQRQPT